MPPAILKRQPPSGPPLPFRDPRIEALIEMYWPPRKMIGRVFMPDFSVIPDHPLRFFNYVFDFTLSSQQTFQQTVTVGHRFYWWGTTGSSDIVMGSPLRYRVAIHDGRTRQKFQQHALLDVNAVGSGQRPYFMRRPHCIPYRRPINVQVENMATQANHVQIVLLGAIYDG